MIKELHDIENLQHYYMIVEDWQGCVIYQDDPVGEFMYWPFHGHA